MRYNKQGKVRIRDTDIEDITYEPVPVFNQNNDSFQLFILIKWNVIKGSLKPLDGFAVHFLDDKTKKNYSESSPNIPINSTSSCVAGGSHMWVRTENRTGCDTEVSHEVSGCNLAPVDSCLCTLPNCSLYTLGYELPCTGTPQFLESQYHQTVPPTVTELMYPAEFHVQYEFSITPYYREFIDRSPFTAVVGSIDNCVDILEKATKSREAANALCCEQGAQNLVAHNLTFSKSVPIFTKEANGTLVNKTVTWLPPSTRSRVLSYHILIVPVAKYTEILNIPLFDNSTSKEDNVTDIGVDNCTFTTLFKHQITIYNLEPNKAYGIRVTPVFEDTELEAWCASAKCNAEKKFFVEAVEDLCNEDYNLCVPSATCLQQPDPNTGRGATCLCDRGLAGDGLVPAIGGGGCFELNECHTDNTSCVAEAICTDRKAPETGVNCTCSSGYDGDGLTDGSGCRSRSLLGVAIALPLIVIIVVVIVILIWIKKKRENDKLKRLLEKYVPDTEHGILISYFNPGSKEHEGPWAPTFGDQWEIDRSNLHFGDVIGRGNYGVVHKAWLKPKNPKGNDSAKNGKVVSRNGDYYNPISSNSTEDDNYENAGEDDSFVVAVKSLQESTDNQKNLENFLMEIAFMLNINHHENIVKIHGCCTSEEPVYLIAEYLQYGDLLHFLWDAREPSKGAKDPVYNVTERSLCIMARDVAKAMEFLQKIRIIHGDIAARNILVGKHGICKLSDFGLANDVYRYGNIGKGQREQIVPYKWISPERMMPGEEPITKHSDVWSFGNLLYEMFTLGCSPHSGVNSEDLLDKLKAGYRMKKPDTCNVQIYGLMKQCWEWKPSSRPSFSLIVKKLSDTIQQLPSDTMQLNFANSLGKLDRQAYDNETAIEMQPKDNVYVNGNVTVVENENEKQTRAI
uniref:uncharacterized protein LOC120341741 isoform X2 n=2 Tax=Styela clava TaxID=7725 RepID=UPI00193A9E6E|nr:uncharacterized protein LOC120341741 isoform X2 [Styela clava]